jgi:hypothetical protein
MGSTRSSITGALISVPAVLAVVAIALVGCVSITPSASTGASAGASAAASPATNTTVVTPEPQRTRRPCRAGDSRTRCQSPGPAASDTSSATDAATDTPPPTNPPTAEPTTVAPGITVTPTELDFGLVTVGSTGEIAVVVTNGGPGPITPDYAGGAPADPPEFGGSQNCAGVTLPELGSCEFTYTFTPPATGPYTSSTTIDVDNTPFSISMRGCGTDGISIPPDCLGGIQQ